MVELATRKPRVSVQESLTPENGTAIIIGAAALIEAHVPSALPCLGRMGHCATYRFKP